MQILSLFVFDNWHGMFYGQQSPAQDNIHYPPELATNLHEDWSFTIIIIIMDYGFYFHNACVNSQSWRRPSWLKVPTSAFTCKKLLKHYDKRALTQGKWMWNANQPARPLHSFPALLSTSPPTETQLLWPQNCFRLRRQKVIILYGVNGVRSWQ